MAALRGLPAGVLRGATLGAPMRGRNAPDPPTVAWYRIVLLRAVILGILAAINPMLAIAGAFGLAFMGLVLVNLTAGLCMFTFLSFLELLLVSSDRSFSFLKVAGFLLFASWIAY